VAPLKLFNRLFNS